MQVDNVEVKLARAKSSQVAVLGLAASSAARKKPFKTEKRCYMAKYNGRQNNRGRNDWRVQGLGTGPDFNFLPPAVSRMVVNTLLPGEWTAWVHYDVLVHHSTVRKHFKSQGCYMVTGCTAGEAEDAAARYTVI